MGSSKSKDCYDSHSISLATRIIKVERQVIIKFLLCNYTLLLSYVMCYKFKTLAKFLFDFFIMILVKLTLLRIGIFHMVLLFFNNNIIKFFQILLYDCEYKKIYYCVFKKKPLKHHKRTVCRMFILEIISHTFFIFSLK